MRNFNIPVLVLAMMLCRSAVGQSPCDTLTGPRVRVQITNTSSLLIFDQCYPSGGVISLNNVNNTWSRINIFSYDAPNNGFANIGRLDLSGTSVPPSLLTVVIGPSSNPTSFANLAVAGIDWGGVTVSGSGSAADLINRVVLHGRVSGNLTGAISTGRIGFVWIEGQTQRVITATSSSLPNASVRTGSIASNGGLTLQTGNILTVEVLGNCAGPIRAGQSVGVGDLISCTVAGDLLSDIEVGDELRSLAVTGRIGTSTTLRLIKVGGNLGTITAGEVNANIRGFSAGTAANAIFRVQTSTAGGFSGSFRGLIQTQRLLWQNPNQSFFQFAGQCLGTISIGEDLVSGQHMITTPSGSLLGQVIIGANSPFSSTWTGPVVVGSTTLAPIPYYDDTAASLGGGAVGLVPFALHREDCKPYDDQVLDPAALPGPSNPILMRHYGPVKWDDANGTPFVIKRRNPLNTAQVTAETACFTQTPNSNKTIVTITPAGSSTVVRGFEYVIERRRFMNGANEENVPRCDLAGSASPPVADSDPLTFTVCGAAGTNDAAAIGDADSDGCVRFADVTSVLVNFGVTDCGKFGDANRDGAVAFSDITAALTNSGLTYCGTCPESLLDGMPSIADGLAAIG